MNIEENKTIKSCFTCSLSSLLVFGVVLEPFRFCVCLFSIFFLLPLGADGSGDWCVTGLGGTQWKMSKS